MTLLKSFIFVAAIAHGSWAMAQNAPDMAPKDATYTALGGQAGLVKLMDDFMIRLLADERTGPFFKPANQQRVKEQLVAQFCEVSGGPCTYKGVDMKTSHKEMDITKAHFNGLVEILQQSMTAQGIAFATQNQLLAKLAPMHRDIITVR